MDKAARLAQTTSPHTEIIYSKTGTDTQMS